MRRITVVKLTSRVLFLCLAAIVGGAYRAPVADAAAFLSQRDSEEIEQGREADRQVEAEFGFYADEALQAYVDRVGHKLAAVSERPALPWTFRILDSPVLNAFAVPGGFVYVTRGIVAHMNSEAELAGVLGHEVGHIAGKHGAKRETKSTLATLGMMLGSVVAPAYVNPLLRSGLAQGATGLLLTKYSRGQELDADERAVRYAVASGYDPRGIGAFFETLQAQQQQDGGQRVPGWLSTHPQVDDRIERSARRADEELQQTAVDPEDLIQGRTALLFAIDGILFGDDPRQGYTDADNFLHPDLRFAITFPPGWEVQNGRQAVVAVEPNEDAILQLSLAPVPEGTAPEAYVRKHLAEIGARVERSRRVSVGGLDGLEASFEVRAQRGSYSALGIWISYEGRLYELLGVTSSRGLKRYQQRFVDSLYSFRELTDPEVLETQPARLELIRVPQPIQLVGLLEAHPENTARPETIELLNHMELHDSLPAGELVKIVTGDSEAQ